MDKNILYIILPPLFIVAAYTEMKSRKIPNYLTYGAIICAVTGSFISGGLPGLQNSVLGLLIGGGVFLPFCLVGALGGGDFKLMAAAGAIVAYPMIFWALYYTCLSGGVLALLYMIWSGRFLSSFENIFRMLLGMKRKEKPGEGLKKEITVPYGIAIAAGTLWAIVMAS